MSSSGKPRGNHKLVSIRSIKIFHLGRGRGRPIIAKEFDAPGGLQDYTESETESFVSQQSGASEITPSDEV